MALTLFFLLAFSAFFLASSWASLSASSFSSFLFFASAHSCFFLGNPHVLQLCLFELLGEGRGVNNILLIREDRFGDGRVFDRVRGSRHGENKEEANLPPKLINLTMPFFRAPPELLTTHHWTQLLWTSGRGPQGGNTVTSCNPAHSKQSAE